MKKLYLLVVFFSFCFAPVEAGFIDGIGSIFGFKYSKKKLAEKMDNVQNEMNGVKGDLGAIKDNTVELQNTMQANLKLNNEMVAKIQLMIKNEFNNNMEAFAAAVADLKVNIASPDSSTNTNQQGEGNTSVVNSPVVWQSFAGILGAICLTLARMWYKTNLAFINSRNQAQKKEHEVKEKELQVKDFKRSYFEKRRELEDMRLMFKTAGININGVNGQNGDSNHEVDKS